MITGIIVGLFIGVPLGYRVRMFYTRQLWRMSRSIKNKAKGL